MEGIEISAKTIEDAVLEAAIQLGTTRDKVSYEVISQGSTGFFGIGGKKAVIKARAKTDEEVEAEQKAEKEMEKILEKVNTAEDKKETAEKETAPEKNTEEKKAADKRSSEKPKQAEIKKENHRNAPKRQNSSNEKKEMKNSEVKTSKAVMSEEKKEETSKADIPAVPVDTSGVQKFLEDVFAAMEMEVSIDIKQNPKEREIDIDLSGDDMGVLIGKRGQTLDSLQYLASLVVNKDSDVYIRVKVDTENYRERRKATLENLAKNIAQKVKRTGKAVTLEPMNPYERRVIHSALQNDKYVTTHSEGEEPYRKVVVTLKEGVKPDSAYNRNKNRNRRGYNNKKRER